MLQTSKAQLTALTFSGGLVSQDPYSRHYSLHFTSDLAHHIEYLADRTAHFHPIPHFSHLHLTSHASFFYLTLHTSHLHLEPQTAHIHHRPSSLPLETTDATPDISQPTSHIRRFTHLLQHMKLHKPLIIVDLLQEARGAFSFGR